MPLSYRRLAPGEFERVLHIPFEPGQVERFLGPLPDMIEAVRRGPAHELIAIEEGGDTIGFFVLHPDRRHGACWWLGWFGIGQAHQGGGRGARALAAILSRLRRNPACREVRLLVAPDNAAAVRLYRRAGFALRGVWQRTGEAVMARTLPPRHPCGRRAPVRTWVRAILQQVVEARACRMGIPVAARLHGEVAFPP